MNSRKAIDEAYMEMIKTNPCGLMAIFLYDINPSPLVSGKEYDPDLNITSADEEEISEKNDEERDDPKNCDVGEEEPNQNKDDDEDEESDVELREHLLKFPKHSQFLLKFRNARIVADRSNTTTYVTWRGHKACMKPNSPSLTYPIFKRKVVDALESIKDISPAESKVKKIITDWSAPFIT